MNINLDEKVSGVSFTKSCSIKPDGDSSESKVINLKIEFEGVSLRDVFEKAVSSTVIQWQAKARKTFNSFVDKSTVTVQFSAPGRTTQDPMDAIISAAKASGMDVTEYMLQELAKRQSK
jgi:hypothetical protein